MCNMFKLFNPSWHSNTASKCKRKRLVLGFISTRRNDHILLSLDLDVDKIVLILLKQCLYNISYIHLNNYLDKFHIPNVGILFYMTFTYHIIYLCQNAVSIVYFMMGS